MSSVGYCDPKNTDAFTVVGWICGLATTVVVCGLVTAFELISVVGCGFATEGLARKP